MRKREFERNWNIVKNHNATKSGYALSINQYADWTVEEFKKILSFKPLSSKRRKPRDGGSTDTTTTALDWRQFGAVTPVKD